MPANSTDLPGVRSRQWLIALAVMGAVLGLLFYKSFLPHQILFANDGPLGFIKAEENQLPGRFAGTWRNLAWLGSSAPVASPTLSSFLVMIVPAEVYLKIYAPLSLLFLGFSMWVFLRSLQLSPVVSVLGGVAVALNMHFFSLACWGLGSWNLCAGMALLAMAAICTKAIKQLWAKAILAGLAVGMAVMEGYDIGAIVSVYVGMFVLFYFLILDGAAVKRVATAFLVEATVVFFAGFIATHTIASLVHTQIEGVAAMEQDVQTKQQRWNADTQWSLPKAESLGLIAPGVFGYRMYQHITERDHSSAYWGLVGQDPRIPSLLHGDVPTRQSLAQELKAPDADMANIVSDDPDARYLAAKDIIRKAGIYWRYRGTGEFAGTMVGLLALFGIANMLRKESPFAAREKWLVGFWTLAALLSLMTAWGRYGFLYRLLYQLPYVSTIRNPIKYLHLFDFTWVILAAYGMEALYRRYLRPAGRPAGMKVGAFEKRWMLFLAATVVVTLAGYMIFTTHANTDRLIDYLEEQTFTPTWAPQVAAFAQSRLLWFLVFLAGSSAVLAAIVKGFWTGEGRKWAWALLGGLLIVDLCAADLPWIRYFDYAEKYAPNPVTDFLEDHPYEHRVIGKLEPKGPGSGITPGFGELYFFWIQNDFPYHNIQTLDFAQAPHLPDLDRLFLKAFELHGTEMSKTDLSPAIRLWRLTNTRYLLATANAAELLNARIDPGRQDFRILKLFNMVRKPDVLEPSDYGDITIQEGEKGSLALIEYTNALPRAKLYSHWQVTNDNDGLQLLSSTAFDPWHEVLVADKTPLSAPPSSADGDPGTVQITAYHPKKIDMQAEVKTPALLWVAERYDPQWKVSVDGKPAPLLRCDYLMRGVYLTPGHHRIQMVFRPSLKTLYISLAAILIGMSVAGFVIVTNCSGKGGKAGETPLDQTAPIMPEPPALEAAAQSAAPKSKTNGTGGSTPPRGKRKARSAR